jgi:hypothetical protein
MSVPLSGPARYAYLIAGWFCVGLGVVGLVVPMVPGAVFLIAAAWCFSRASPRFEAWLVNHPWLGPPIRNWRDGGIIPTNVKIIAIASLIVSFTVLAFLAAPVFVLAGVGALFVGIAGYIVTRPPA